MSKPKTPTLPDAPTFFEEPLFREGFTRLSDLGERLTSFDLTGDLSPLQQTIDLDPEVSRLALASASGVLGEQADIRQRDVANRLAQLGALESSTTATAFSDIERSMQTQLQSITAQAALQDRQRAIENRLRLFGTGLETTQAGTSFAQQAQAARNLFNLRNFQNQVDVALNRQAGSGRGGLMGGLTGALGGAMTGAAFGGPVGAVIGGIGGGAAGALGPAGTGGQIMSAGTTLGGGLGLPKIGQTRGAGTALMRSRLGRMGPGAGAFQSQFDPFSQITPVF